MIKKLIILFSLILLSACAPSIKTVGISYCGNYFNASAVIKDGVATVMLGNEQVRILTNLSLSRSGCADIRPIGGQ